MWCYEERRKKEESRNQNSPKTFGELKKPIFYTETFQIRKTKSVSAFPVGFVGDAFVSTPIVDKNGKFVRFHDGWIGGRTYPMDMAGFAVGVDHFIKVNFSKIFVSMHFFGCQEKCFESACGRQIKKVCFDFNNSWGF